MPQLNFDSLVDRFGEVVAQSLLENLERFEGVRNEDVAPLEDRWQSLMKMAA